MRKKRATRRAEPPPTKEDEILINSPPAGPARGRPLLMDSRLSFKLVRPSGVQPLLLDNRFSFKLVMPGEGAKAIPAERDLSYHDNESLLREYHEAAAGGNAEKSNKLVWEITLANDRLIEYIARKLFVKYRCQEHGIDIGDLKSAGYGGMRYAVEKFDPAEGTKFSAYAYHQVFSRMLRYIQDNNLVIPVPFYKQEKLRVMHKVKDLLAGRGVEPTDRAIAQYMDWSEKEIAELHAIPASDGSLDALFDIEDADKPRNLYEMYAANSPSQTGEQITAEMQAQEIKKWIRKVISVREYLVLNLRYGLDDEGSDHKTLKEVGDALHLTKERIRQIERKALEKLRAFYSIASKEVDTTELFLESLSIVHTKPLVMDNEMSFKLVKPEGTEQFFMDSSLSFKYVHSENSLRFLRKKMKQLLKEHPSGGSADLLKELDQDERAVVEVRYGLRDGAEKTLKQTAAMLNMNLLKVWKCEGKALAKLQKSFDQKK